MEMNLADQYYLKALGGFPWKLDSVVENLQYALSYDEDHVPSLCLEGMMQMYVLKDYDKAEECFSIALSCKLNHGDTYKHFALLKIWKGQYEEAEKMIMFAMTMPAIDQCAMLRLQSMSKEYKGQYKVALQLLKQARIVAVQDGCIYVIDEDMKRVKAKKKLAKKVRKS